MKILVIGSGGREHALCHTLKRTSGRRIELYCAPGSDSIAEIAHTVAAGATDVAALAAFAETEKIELTIVGGEAPLAAGLVDEFERRGLAVAGPRAEAARLESSKAFAKEFMARHKIPTARFRVAASAREAREILESGEFGAAESPVVVKADGLAAGKGVVVAETRAEALQAIGELMEGGRVGSEAARRVVIEETLTGPEVSLLFWTDGTTYALMPPARDHKRIGEGDTGPNTGGMGAITSPDVLDEATHARVVREIVEPTLAGLRADGLEFRGVIFIGLMLTPDGPRVLEYNVRFGDPEAQAILVRLESDLVEIFAAVAHKNLKGARVEWSQDASACVVLAARGYPDRPETGARIEGLQELQGSQNLQALQDSQNLQGSGGAQPSPGVQIFHAGTTCASDGAWQTAGGRVLGVTSRAPSLDLALKRCYETVRHIRWEGMQYRRDIGQFSKS